METLPEDFIGYIRQIQALTGHEAHSFRLAKALGIDVRLGKVNSVRPAAWPRPVMELSHWDYGGDTPATRHELNHILLYWSGLEKAIFDEYGEESGRIIMENLCNQTAASLQITQPMVDDAVGRYGVTARAVRHLQKLSGASPDVALRRLIYDKASAMRAGWLLSGHHIIQTEDCNHGLPFFRLDRVPEPKLLFPKEIPCSMLRLPYGGLSIGVVGW